MTLTATSGYSNGVVGCGQDQDNYQNHDVDDVGKDNQTHVNGQKVGHQPDNEPPLEKSHTNSRLQFGKMSYLTGRGQQTVSVDVPFEVSLECVDHSLQIPKDITFELLSDHATLSYSLHEANSHTTTGRILIKGKSEYPVPHHEATLRVLCGGDNDLTTPLFLTCM